VILRDLARIAGGRAFLNVYHDLWRHQEGPESLSPWGHDLRRHKKGRPVSDPDSAYYGVMEVTPVVCRRKSCVLPRFFRENGQYAGKVCRHEHRFRASIELNHLHTLSDTFFSISFLFLIRFLSFLDTADAAVMIYGDIKKALNATGGVEISK
jgi:hypothetical protein